MKEALAHQHLRKKATEEEVTRSTSHEFEPITGIIGQDRAIKALKFGLGIEGNGFNIFLSGQPGTGKHSAAHRFINQIAKDQPTPDDWIYVNNFRDASKPKAISLPAGKGAEFRQDMKNFLNNATERLKEAFESDDFSRRKDEIVQKHQKEKDDLFQEVNRYARENNYAIKQGPAGFETIPLNQHGQPMKSEEFNKLDAELRKELEEKGREVQQNLKETLRKIQKIEREMHHELNQLEEDVANYAIDPLIDELQEKYGDNEKIQSYLNEVMNEIIQNLSMFLQNPGQQGGQQGMMQQADPYQAIQKEKFMKQFEINLLVDHKDTTGAPVINENHPSHPELFGRIEKESKFGTLETDFTLIKPGSIHEANGGYIMIPVEDLLRNPFSWETLVNALKTEEITIEDATEKLGFMSTKSLRPDHIPLNIKVILIGTPYHYQILYQWIEDFRKLFKVKSEFDTVMERNDENLNNYMGFISMLCNERSELCHLENSALKEVIEYGSRLAEHQNKLSSQFRSIFDIISEANYYASSNSSKQIKGEHVKQAIEEKVYRSNLIQEKLQEMIKEDTILIDIEGKKTGKINGLAVLSTGDFSFGKPNKITTSLGLGKGEVLDIEREAKTGGPIHTKGVLILSGYLMHKYGIDQPLNISIRLVFEQSYSGVEGDSASSAEVFSIMSEVGDIPINQGIAVTGSMNQKGEVQPIGGVNEKIEGFFEVCREKGLTGEQGVIIPESNVKNLMLKDEVVEACKNNQFNVWPIKTIDEGFEILSGYQPGEPDEDGQYPENTFNRIIRDKIYEYYKKYSNYQQNSGS